MILRIEVAKNRKNKVKQKKLLFKKKIATVQTLFGIIIRLLVKQENLYVRLFDKDNKNPRRKIEKDLISIHHEILHYQQAFLRETDESIYLIEMNDTKKLKWI